MSDEPLSMTELIDEKVLAAIDTALAENQAIRVQFAGVLRYHRVTEDGGDYTSWTIVSDDMDHFAFAGLAEMLSTVAAANMECALDFCDGE